MGRVLTNNTSLAYSIESALGIAGTTWFLLEPNAISTFGAVTTTESRSPISRNRQRRKGTVTDLDSAAEFDGDLTLSAFRDFIEGFCFVTGINSNVSQIGIASAETTGDSYTLTDDFGVAQADKIEVDTLLWVTGNLSAGNNGLKSVDTDMVGAVAATETLTLALNVADTETVTIDTKVYTFQTTLTNVDGNVLIGATASASLDNLIAAITLGVGAGSTYAAVMTEHPTVTAVAGAGDTMDATAKDIGTAGNAIATTETLAGVGNQWGGATLSGGTASRVIAVAENLVDETSPANLARMSFAGHRIAAGDTATWAWNVAAKEATLTETGVGTLLQALGLTAGETVHIGSILAAGDTTVVNAFQSVVANDMYGYARVKSFTANTVVFDKVDTALQFNDSTAPTTAVDVLFGEFIRNVSTASAEFLERSFQFEAEFPNLANPSGDEYEYSKGNFCNTATFTLPLAGKATAAFGFTGTDTDNPSETRKTGASAATNPTQTGALNTSADILQLRVTEVDETGLTTDFKSIALTLNNNVSPEKVLGTLGAKFLNTGNFEVDVEAKLVFTNGRVVDKVRANETVTMDFILRNDDAIIAVDIPSMTLGGGGREYPVNESVLINTKGEAFLDDTLGTSLGISIIPVPLPSAA
jgi:hypothetical protein